jgi:hypothetical protein
LTEIVAKDDNEPRHEHAAPEGAVCAEHPDREALFTCPRCGHYACLTCWHPVISRCAACMRRDPTEAAPPLPWETAEGNAVTRFVATLGTAFKPTRSAPAFAKQELAPALRFFALSTLPFVLLMGIIPHTRTLEFGNAAIALVGAPTQAQIALDVARAIGVQLVLSGLEFASLFFPFTSLVRAYAVPERRAAAARVVLYRFWLGPSAALLVFLAIWLSPMSGSLAETDAIPLPIVVASFVQLAFHVLRFSAMWSAARLACGLSVGLALVVVLVPFLLHMMVMPLAAQGLESVLPPSPAASR